MSKKTGTSFFGRSLHRIKKIILSLLKVIYILPFFVFGLWLLSFVYFSGFDLNEAISISGPSKDDDVFQLITKTKEAVPRDHFHMIDAYVERQDPNPPICVVCHGTYPHGKEKKVRALLNLHTGFVACSVCHARQDGKNEAGDAKSENAIIKFLWVDWETNEIKDNVKGEYGKYPAKIYPIKFTEKGPRRIFTPVNAEAAQRFLKMRAKLTPDQVAEAKAKLHGQLSEKPVFCSDCHKKNGYLDFIKLGFPKRRVNHLMSSEFVGMIDKYKTFYLPAVIDFSR